MLTALENAGVCGAAGVGTTGVEDAGVGLWPEPCFIGDWLDQMHVPAVFFLLIFITAGSKPLPSPIQATCLGATAAGQWQRSSCTAAACTGTHLEEDLRELAITAAAAAALTATLMLPLSRRCLSAWQRRWQAKLQRRGRIATSRRGLLPAWEDQRML